MKTSGVLLGILIKALLCCFFFLEVSFEGKGQAVECVSIEPTEKEIAEREKLVSRLRQRQAGARVHSTPFTFVPVKFHILRKSDGSGGATNAQVNQAFAKLNDHYRMSGIQFYLAGSTPNFIASDEFYDYEYSEEDALTDGHDLTNAANIYVVNSINFQSSSATGYAYYPSVLAISNRIFIKADRLGDARTLAHELGHYFNLLHTFHNNANADTSLRELVTRNEGANCAIAGDLVCDTPADPQGLPGATTMGCSYTGTAKDVDGEPYKPSLTNMMSYYYSCGNEFTGGQSERMGGGLLLRTNPSNQYTLDYPGIAAVPSQVVASQTKEGVRITFADVGTGASGYLVERATDGNGPYVPIGGLDANVTSFLDIGVSAHTLYYYRVRASNSTEYSTADTAQVSQFYCKPTYYSAGSPMIIADFFLSKNGSSLIAKTNTGSGTESYSDFTATVGEVTAGQSYEVMARAVTGGSGSYYPQHFSVWIDLDQNGVFEANELVFQTTQQSYMSPTTQGTIAISPQALPGKTRMRIRSQYFSYGLVTTSCGQLTYGEAEDYTLLVRSNGPPTIQTASLSSSAVCRGDSVRVFFTTSGTFNPGNNFAVQLARGAGGAFFNVNTQGTASPLTAILPDTLSAGADYRVRVIGSNPLVSGAEAAQTLRIKPQIQATLSGGGSVAAGDSASLIVTRTSGGSPWHFVLSNGVSYQAGSATEYSVRLAPDATTTYTLARVQSDECGLGTGSGTATVTVTAPMAVSLQIRVFMEGPYRSSTGKMITTLNQRGLLPGQTPVGSTASPTPPGQPYNRSPWNYDGGESAGTYQANVVDWILISLRAGSPSVNNTVYRAAALLENDGRLTITNLPILAANESYYVVIEHRNHLGIMSHKPVPVQNNTLSYDFTTQNSYTNTDPVSVGQKQIGTVFAMHSGDGNKNVPNQNFVINVNDYTLWSGANGKFDLYSEGDFNMDAQVSASDKVLWNNNNSKFSLIGRL